MLDWPGLLCASSRLSSLKGKLGGGVLGEYSGASLPFLHSKNLLTEEGPLACEDATTPIRVSFSLDYKNNEDSHQREAVAVTMHSFAMRDLRLGLRRG